MSSAASPAPVVVFAYQRPDHIKRALQTLKGNPECSSSPVFIYCDGPRTPADERMVNRTRAMVAKHAPAHAKVILRDQNMGLAASVIEGVTNACNEYGRVIVVEDDLELASGALSYLNRSLEHFQHDEQVMHVSAYMFPTDIDLPEAFFYREATCWGWATWGRAWQHFNPDALGLAKEIEARDAVNAFNVNGSMFFMQMLRKQAAGEISSWAIRWYASMFLRDGLSLHPSQSLVANGGFDGTGEHSSKSSLFEVERAESWTGTYPTEFNESQHAVLAMMDYRADRFLPGDRVWPDFANQEPLAMRKSTGRPIDLENPIPSRKPQTSPQHPPGLLNRLGQRLRQSLTGRTRT